MGHIKISSRRVSKAGRVGSQTTVVSKSRLSSFISQTSARDFDTSRKQRRVGKAASTFKKPIKTSFKGTKPTAFKVSRTKRPTSAFPSQFTKGFGQKSKKPEQIAFNESRTSEAPKRKVGKSFVFSKQKKAAKTAQLPFFALGFQQIVDIFGKKSVSGKKSTAEQQAKKSTSLPKVSVAPAFSPPTITPQQTEFDFFGAIADFFGGFFGGTTTQQAAGDAGSISIDFGETVTLPPLSIAPDIAGQIPQPEETFGGLFAGVAPTKDDGESFLDKITKDPVVLGIAAIGGISLIAAFTARR